MKKGNAEKEISEMIEEYTLYFSLALSYHPVDF